MAKPRQFTEAEVEALLDLESSLQVIEAYAKEVARNSDDADVQADMEEIRRVAEKARATMIMRFLVKAISAAAVVGAAWLIF